MIPKKKLEELKDILQKAKNPLFFHDDDPDGLASFLLLRKFKGKAQTLIGVDLEKPTDLCDEIIYIRGDISRIDIPQNS